MPIEKDPVCGMDVDTTATDLKIEHDGTTYWFCGKGCLLEFRDDPDRYLDPDYTPSMLGLPCTDASWAEPGRTGFGVVRLFCAVTGVSSSLLRAASQISEAISCVSRAA